MNLNQTAFDVFQKLHDVCGEAIFVFAGNGREEMFLECEYGEFNHL